MKLCKWGVWWYSTAVTPFVGVWIEINVNRIKRTYIKSLPSWECGLKYTTVARGDGEQRSLPSWECGLKSDNGHCRLSVYLVTPFVGVWIEILFYPFSYLPRPSLPSWECGLKFFGRNLFRTDIPSLPSWECGLKYECKSV